MQYWKVKAPVIKGKNYASVIKEAYQIFHLIERSTKRHPHLRSKCFHRQKVFIDTFWDHLKQKNPKDRRRRLRYYGCALDLIRNCTIAPEVKKPPNKTKLVWYRLFGITENQEKFIVQIKEDKGEKHLISIFPYEEK